MQSHAIVYKTSPAPVINSTQETAAKVRVSAEPGFQGESYGTVGVNVDIIKASWTALVKAYENALLQHEDLISEQSSVES
jgi:hypothetical protein